MNIDTEYVLYMDMDKGSGTGHIDQDIFNGHCTKVKSIESVIKIL
jgi:hypothetical protein